MPTSARTKQTEPTKQPAGVRSERLHVRINTSTMRLLDSHVDNNRFRGASRSSVVDAAIRAYTQPDDQMPAIFRAINRLENHVDTTSKRLDMLGNAFLHYLRYWFVLWPDLSPEVTRQNQVKANDRVAKFLRSLQRRTNKKDLYQLLDPEHFDTMIQEFQQTVTALLAQRTGTIDEEGLP